MRYETIYEKVDEHNGYKNITLKSGRKVTFYDAEREAEDHLSSLYRWVSRMEKLAGTHEYGHYDWERIERFIDQVDALVGFTRDEIAKHNVHKQKEERIAALRNVTGRTQAEAAAFLAKADQLEQEL